MLYHLCIAGVRVSMLVRRRCRCFGAVLGVGVIVLVMRMTIWPSYEAKHVSSVVLPARHRTFVPQTETLVQNKYENFEYDYVNEDREQKAESISIEQKAKAISKSQKAESISKARNELSFRNSNNVFFNLVKQLENNQETKQQQQNNLINKSEKNHTSSDVLECVTGDVVGRIPPNLDIAPISLSTRLHGARENTQDRHKSFQHVYDTKAWGYGWDSNNKGLNVSGNVSGKWFMLRKL